MGLGLKREKVKKALEGTGKHGGCLVIADTINQVLNNACKGEAFESILLFVLAYFLTFLLIFCSSQKL